MTYSIPPKSSSSSNFSAASQPGYDPTALIELLVSSRQAYLNLLDNLLITKALVRLDQQAARTRAELVHGGEVLDALVEGLRHKKMEHLSTFFPQHVAYLVEAGFNFEQIELIYDSVEQSLTSLTEARGWDSKSFPSSWQFIAIALQLARTLAVTHTMAHSNAEFLTRSQPGPTSQVRELNQEFKPLQPHSLPSSQLQTHPTLSVAGEGNTASLYEFRMGYLEWPLRAVIGSGLPVLYYLRLDDSRLVQALLVAPIEAYTRTGIVKANTLSCKYRLWQRSVVAYPL